MLIWFAETIVYQCELYNFQQEINDVEKQYT